MRIDIITGFPDFFRGPFDESIIKRARDNGLVDIGIHDLRDFTHDRHRTIDDYPYGGSAGMVLKPEPIAKAIKQIEGENPDPPRVIYLTPQGEKLTQKKANDLSLLSNLILICGHYRGMDERIRIKYVTDEISIGDYVLTGGEVAAIVLVDAVIRLIPGAIGDFESALGDSFQEGILDCPWYTRPAEFEGLRVPEVLLSGNHGLIEEWRKKEAIKRTFEKRPDLIDFLELDKAEIESIKEDMKGEKDDK